MLEVNRVKILYFTNYSELYGANKSLVELIKKLKLNFNVEPIVISPKRGNLNVELDKLGVENYTIYFFPWTSSLNSKIKYNIKRIGRKAYNNISISKILSIINDKNIDIVHTNSTVVDVGCIIANIINKPHIWHIREFGKEDYNMEFFDTYDVSINAINNYSDRIIFISQSLYDKYKLNINSQKARIIYNGVETDKYYIEMKPKKYDENLHVIFSGLIIPNKNQFELVKAVNYLVNIKKKQKIMVTFIGEGDLTYINSIKAFIKENKLEKYINFTGYLSNVTKILDGADIGIISSLKEAFGRVTVEYMMAGLAVIASDTGANLEILENESNGLKIEMLYDDQELLIRLTKNAQEKALSTFTSDINAKNIFNIYKEILN
jgi:glycosyltransferase involved in cell wall biosynthesis